MRLYRFIIHSNDTRSPTLCCSMTQSMCMYVYEAGGAVEMGGGGCWWCQHNIGTAPWFYELIDPLCEPPLPHRPPPLLPHAARTPSCAALRPASQHPAEIRAHTVIPSEIRTLTSLFFRKRQCVLKRKKKKEAEKKCTLPVVSDPYWCECNWFPPVWSLSQAHRTNAGWIVKRAEKKKTWASSFSSVHRCTGKGQHTQPAGGFHGCLEVPVNNV